MDEKKRKKYERNRARYKERRENKLCVECGKQDERTISGKSICSDCAKKRSKAGLYYRTARKDHLCCIKCGSQDGRTKMGRNLCGKCTEKIKGAEWYSEVLKKRQERREQRKKQGVCAQCGGLIEKAGDIYCTKCREYWNLYRRRGKQE